MYSTSWYASQITLKLSIQYVELLRFESPTLSCLLQVLKLGFTVGIIPSLNIAAGLIGFTGIKGFVYACNLMGLKTKPFTRQENTVIQSRLSFQKQLFKPADKGCCARGTQAARNAAAKPVFLSKCLKAYCSICSVGVSK